MDRIWQKTHPAKLPVSSSVHFPDRGVPELDGQQRAAFLGLEELVRFRVRKAGLGSPAPVHPIMGCPYLVGALAGVSQQGAMLDFPDGGDIEVQVRGEV